MTPPVHLLPLEVGEVDRLARRVRLRRAVGEAAADAGFPERAQVGVGEFGPADVVAPVVHEGDAAVQRLRGGEPGALVHVLGEIDLAEGGRSREVAVLALVARHAAQERVPHVPMRLDEARQHDHASAFYHLRAARRNVAADRDDCAAPYVHVGLGQVAGRGVHGHHVGVADHEFAPLGQLARLAAAAHEPRAAARAECAEGGHSAEKFAPRGRFRSFHMPSVTRVR